MINNTSAANATGHRPHWLSLFLFALLAPCLHIPAWATDTPTEKEVQQWELVREADSLEQTSVYTRYIAGATLKAFKGITHSQAPFEQILATLLDIESMPEWFFRCSNARIIEQTGPLEGIGYIQLKGIWPVQDRYIVTRGTLHQDPQTLAITIAAVETDYPMPEQDNKVRIPDLEASWTLTPMEDGWTRIQLIGHADPGGAIPLWLANSVVTLMPRITLKNLKKRLEELPKDLAIDQINAGFNLELLTLPGQQPPSQTDSPTVPAP